MSHLYNLRASKIYQRQRCVLTRTRPKAIPIGQRRKPCPNDQPGYIRIDSVHQGDQDKRKGVYHVNAVDEVTQFQVIVTLERISEAFMLPALEQILAAFPFKIRGFHADNGGEYINYSVAELLDKLRIEFTKSRPGTAMTMAWLKVKMAPSFANFMAIRTYLSSTPRTSLNSIASRSTGTSTSTGLAISLPQLLMQRVKSGRNTATKT